MKSEHRSTSLSRRSLLTRGSVALATATAASSVGSTAWAASREPNSPKSGEGEILGQGEFRYRANRFWGVLDRQRYPVQDCHGISGDRHGRIVTLTNHPRNNLIAYNKGGGFLAAWETRFPGAHGLDIVDHGGRDQYWITDQTSQEVSVRTAEGKELLHVGPEALASVYPDLGKYHPTGTATLPEGDFFIADGYGSSFIHHFDPAGRYISSFGGEGKGPENLNTPHAVWIDTRSGKPQLLVTDRGNNALKWFSLKGELLRVVSLGEEMERNGERVAARPGNVAQFGGYRAGRFNDHLAIACLRGMILILDGGDRVVSVVGGAPATYVDGKLQTPEVYNYTLTHPHDVYVDAAGALYVAQWWSSQTYPIKLEPLRATA
jgi:peptidylamidoglycolate lyase